MILHGNCLTVLATLDSNSIQCCVTSPPYYGLRDYGVAGQLGLEPSPNEYVAKLVEVFREVKRVLRDDGTLWLNLGDSYATSPAGNKPGTMKACSGLPNSAENLERRAAEQRRQKGYGDCKPKDLLGIPWRVAFALQADGWYLRSDIIWHKSSVMPQSAKDRPTNCHEHVFLLSKSPHYYYDAAAIREPCIGKGQEGGRKTVRPGVPGREQKGGSLGKAYDVAKGRNCRNVWTINPQNYKGSHFAVMPMALAERCILAGTSEHGCCCQCGSPHIRQLSKPTGGVTTWHDHSDDLVKGQRKAGGQKAWDSYVASSTIGWHPTCQCNAAVIPCTVLDPFAGVGTTMLAAYRHDREAVMIELNEQYVEQMKQRIGLVPTIILGSTAA